MDLEQPFAQYVEGFSRSDQQFDFWSLLKDFDQKLSNRSSIRMTCQQMLHVIHDQQHLFFAQVVDELLFGVAWATEGKMDRICYGWNRRIHRSNRRQGDKSASLGKFGDVIASSLQSQACLPDSTRTNECNAATFL